MKRIFLSLASVLGVLALGGLALLYPRETVPAPPESVPLTAFQEIDVPFTHTWTRRETTYPFLGAAVLDVEGDGTYEIFVGGAEGQDDVLLAYQDGQLVDRMAGTGLSSTDATYGVTAIDLDADGDTDLAIARDSGVTIYTNEGGVFAATPLDVELDESAVPFSVAVSDFDADGDADLYVSAFVDFAEFRSATFNDPSHAKLNVLLRRDSTGYVDVTDQAGVAGLQNTFFSTFVDLDGDRRQDLVLAQNTGEVEIYQNASDGTFERVSLRTGFGFWMSLSVGDVDADGDPDLFFSNSGNSVPDFLLTGDLRGHQPLATDWLLLINEGNFRFTDASLAYGLRDFAFAWGGGFEDVNLDGQLDLLVAQNYLKLPNFRLRRVPGKVLVQSDGRFFHADPLGLNNEYYGHAPVFADLNGDRRPDVLWLNMDGPARAFLNQSETSAIEVSLPDDLASLGARVRVETPAGPSYTQFALAGNGLMTDASPSFFFAMPNQEPARVEIEYLDGRVVTVDSVQAGQRVSVE
ncbi:MAG: VCBS repeat-containing protein [Bacteroidota bacterium]